MSFSLFYHAYIDNPDMMACSPLGLSFQSSALIKLCIVYGQVLYSSHQPQRMQRKGGAICEFSKYLNRKKNQNLFSLQLLMRQHILIFCLVLWSAGCMSIKYGYEGMDSQQFSQVVHKYPIPALIRVLQNMGNNTELVLRPFNFGSTKSYEEHTGLGKNTNVKGKSCRLKDQKLNGKITYIQSNEYTGRNDPESKITYIGKYLDKDRTILNSFKNIAPRECERWRDLDPEDIKEEIADQIFNTETNAASGQAAIEYLMQRPMFKPQIEDKTYLTTEFVTVINLTSDTPLRKTEEICEHGHCQYKVSSEMTNQVQVLAYQAFDLDQCTFVELELVADMDIYTIHFPYEDYQEDPVDLYKYIDDPTGQNCADSFKFSFGISPNIQMVYDYVFKLINATAEWGLVRHSMEALNLCFTQPFERDNYYLILRKSLLGNAAITVVYEGKDSNIIADTVREWILEGECTPINPYWMITENSKQPGALLWKTEGQVNSILESRKFRKNSCPTYDVIKRLTKKGKQLRQRHSLRSVNHAQHKKSLA